jgi:hypothetical protein
MSGGSVPGRINASPHEAGQLTAHQVIIEERALLARKLDPDR